MTDRLPKGWKFVPISFFVLTQKGKKPRKLSESYFEGSIPYLDIKAIEKNIISKYADKDDTFLAVENDILMVWDGARSGWVGTSVSGAIGSTIMKLNPIVVNSRYLFYFLQSNFNYINSQTKGTGIPHVDQTIFWQLKVPLPPIQEQKRISNSLEKLLQNIYSIQSRLDNIPKFITEIRQQILGQAENGILTKDWRRKNGYKNLRKNIRLIDQTTKIGSGSTPHGGQSVYKQKGIPLIRSMNVHSQGFSYSGLAFIDKKQAHELRNVIVKKGDVLLNITGASIGRVCLAPKDMEGARVNQHVCIIRTKHSISQPYLYYYLSSPKMQKFIDEENYGATRQALTKQMIDNIEIPLPDIKEQKEIVKRVNSLFKMIDKVEKNYQSLRIIIDELPQLILAKAYRGQLVPQNPKDELVEKLLIRIKEEKTVLLSQQIMAKKNRFIKRHGIKEMKEKKRKELLTIIKSYPNGISPEELLLQANYSLKEIDDFYKNLKLIQDKIIEIKPKNSKKEWPKITSVVLKSRGK